MKRLLATTTLIFFIASAAAFGITAQAEQQIVDQTLAALGKAPLMFPDSFPVHRLCGTPFIMDAKQRYNELSPASQARLQGVLATRPSLPQFIDVPLLGGQSGPGFRIHFSVTGPDSVRNASTDLRGFGSPAPNGVPDWVDTVGLVLDSVWIREVDQLGFRAPLSDAGCPAGDGPRFDVYLQDLGGIYLGFTDDDGSGCYQQNRATAFMVLDNDYYGLSAYPEPEGPRRVLRVTAAHEFNHAIQFAYNAFGAEVGAGTGPYWYEATAVWMEDQVYNEIDDYLQYLPFWFRHPELSFRTFSTNLSDYDRSLHPYALAIYGHYLSTRFPNPPYGYSAVRRIWENMAASSGFNLFAAIDGALAPMGYNFLSSLREFYRWNYFVGPKVPLNAPDTLYGAEAAPWPTFARFDLSGQSHVDTTDVYPTRFPSPYSPCQTCPPAAIAFFCAPCQTVAGSPCLTECGVTCRFVPYQLLNSAFCINPLEDLGASYLTLQNVNRSSRIVFDLIRNNARPTTWFAGGGAYDTLNRTLEILGSGQSDLSGQINELVFDEIGNYTEVVVTVVNDTLLPPGSARAASEYAYSVTDSSIPPGVTRILDPRPNPFHPGLTPKVFFPVDLDSLAGDWDISVTIFSPAGEIVFSEKQPFRGGVTYKTKLGWNGENESGKPAASGIYFCKIIMKEVGRPRKVEKVSKIALIRH